MYLRLTWGDVEFNNNQPVKMHCGKMERTCIHKNMIIVLLLSSIIIIHTFDDHCIKINIWRGLWFVLENFVVLLLARPKIGYLGLVLWIVGYPFHLFLVRYVSCLFFGIGDNLVNLIFGGCKNWLWILIYYRQLGCYVSVQLRCFKGKEQSIEWDGILYRLFYLLLFHVHSCGVVFW